MIVFDAKEKPDSGHPESGLLLVNGFIERLLEEVNKSDEVADCTEVYEEVPDHV